MTSIQLTLANAIGTQKMTMAVDQTMPVQELLKRLFARLGLPAPGTDETIGQLFYRKPREGVLYDPRKGILALEKTIQESELKSEDTIRYFIAKAEDGALSTIKLAGDHLFSEVGLCILVEWQNKQYPIILPAKVTPSHNRQSLLNRAIFRQIADIEGPETRLSNALSNDWRYYNTRTKRWIEPTDTDTPLSDHFKHGDHVRIVSSDSLITIDGQISHMTGHRETGGFYDDPLDISIDEEILDQIVIEEPKKEKTMVTINQSTLELVQGDITEQKTDAIVNAANSQLRGGGGVDGAIHRAAGPQLVRASRILAPCPPGEAVLTPGYRLPARWVIHTVGPRYQGGARAEGEVLANAYRNSLMLAINSGFTSIAFPSISTGVYGYPIKEAAAVALHTTINVLETHGQPKIVRFVLFGNQDYRVYKRVLQNLTAEEA